MTGRPNPEPETVIRCPRCNFGHHDSLFEVCRDCGAPLNPMPATEVGIGP